VLAPPNQLPEGKIDRVSCDDIAGWAQDPDTPSNPTAVHIYSDGGTFVGAVFTGALRSDGKPGWGLSPIPDFLKTGTHTISAAAIDSSDSSLHTWLGSSGTSLVLNCSPVVPPPEPIGGGSGPTRAFNCIVASRSFNIAECFHPARILGYETSAGFGYLAGDILMIITGIAGSLALMFIVIAGIKFVTSGGDPKATEQAKHTLTWAVLGLAALVGSWFILRLIETFTGVNIHLFDICITPECFTGPERH